MFCLDLKSVLNLYNYDYLDSHLTNFLSFILITTRVVRKIIKKNNNNLTYDSGRRLPETLVLTGRYELLQASNELCRAVSEFRHLQRHYGHVERS